MDLDRRHLEHLAAVAEHRSVTRAAEALGITQPGLSRSIQELERRLGLRLFDRLPQGAVPTSACGVLLERARMLMTSFDEFERAAQRLGESYEGSLAFGFGPSVASGSALLEASRFLALHPGLRCRIVIASPDELAERLRSLELEFVVADHTSIDASPAAIVDEPLEYEGVLLCRAGHPLLRAEHPEAEILRYPMAITGPPLAGLAALRHFLREQDPTLPADWTPALVLDQSSALRRVLLDGDFLGGSAAYAYADDLRTGTLRLVPLSRSVYRGRVGPFRLRDRSLSPAAEVLWKAIVAALRSDLAVGSALEATS